MCVLISNYCKFKVKLLLNAKGLTKMNEVIPRIYGTHWSSEYTQEQDNASSPDGWQRKGPEVLRELRAGTHRHGVMETSEGRRLASPEDSRRKAVRRGGVLARGP